MLDPQEVHPSVPRMLIEDSDTQLLDYSFDEVGVGVICERTLVPEIVIYVSGSTIPKLAHVE